MGRWTFWDLLWCRFLFPWVGGCCSSRASTTSLPLQTASFLLKWLLASELVKTSSSNITLPWMDSLGNPIWVGFNSFTMALITKSIAIIRLSDLKGIRFDMIIFFPLLLFLLLACTGLIFFLLILAKISEAIIEAAVKTDSQKKSSGNWYSFSVPM